MYSEVPYECKLNVIVEKVMVANYHYSLLINPEERSTLLIVLSLCRHGLVGNGLNASYVVPVPN
jgi:hypothetical protein